MTDAMSMEKFSIKVFRVFMMTINNKNEKNDRGKSLSLTVILAIALLTSTTQQQECSNNNLLSLQVFLITKWKRCTVFLSSYKHECKFGRTRKSVGT